MPRPASLRKSRPARRPVPTPVRTAARKRPAAQVAKAAKPAKAISGARADAKPTPRDSRASGDRRASEKILHAGRSASAESAASASRGKYVYCIIESGDPLRFGPIGVGADPSDVYTVHYKNLAAVVSDAPLEVLDSTRENVLAHERVNETVMHEHTVIPMSFGTIFKTREDIVELLRSAAEAFGDVLNKMQNKLVVTASVESVAGRGV